MRIKEIALSAALAAGLAAVPLAGANAQYYGPPCTPFPLTWPFCVAGAAVYTAGAIVTAPFRALAPPPVAYYPPPSPAAYPAPAPAPAPRPWRWRRWCRNHPYQCHY
jgi:hypothetical protein